MHGDIVIIVSKANGTRVIKRQRMLYRVCGWRKSRLVGSIVYCSKFGDYLSPPSQVIGLALKSRETLAEARSQALAASSPAITSSNRKSSFPHTKKVHATQLDACGAGI
ncbi:hypothetical protein FB451DRAFT_1178091 [Mycena latifolia]|nr:hypothetical protein FB451DRAFT_1178091 [Mycena latifolia]